MANILKQKLIGNELMFPTDKSFSIHDANHQAMIITS